MSDFTSSSPLPDLLNLKNEERPGSVFSELSSEPDRLYIHEGTDEHQNVLNVEILPSQSVSTSSQPAPRPFDGAIDYSIGNGHTPEPWGYTNTSQAQNAPLLFRPFLPIATSQPVAAVQSRYPGPYNYPTSQMPVSTEQYQTPDAEVSFYSWLADDAADTDSYYNPGSNRSTTTPSSISTTTSHSSTPTDFDVTDAESADTDQTTAIETVQETLRRRIHGKSKRSRKSGELRATFPYQRHPKPPYTYCGLIVTAIMLSPRKLLTLAGIHRKLEEMFVFFRGDYTGWRHSVRHNMSHNDCFVKAGLADDDKAEKKNSYYWRVDPSSIPVGSFCVQRNSEFKSGTYAEHIYEQLSLPASLYDFDLKTVCRCRMFDGPPLTPRTDTDSTRQLRLPHVTNCALPTESPEAYRSRDVAANSSLNASFSEERGNPSPSPVISAGSRHSSPYLQASGGLGGYNRISQYIMSSGGSEWTSTAVENLSFLCNNLHTSS